MQKLQLYIYVHQSYAQNTIGSIFFGHCVYIRLLYWKV